MQLAKAPFCMFKRIKKLFKQVSILFFFDMHIPRDLDEQLVKTDAFSLPFFKWIRIFLKVSDDNKTASVRSPPLPGTLAQPRS